MLPLRLRVCVGKQVLWPLRSVDSDHIVGDIGRANLTAVYCPRRRREAGGPGGPQTGTYPQLIMHQAPREGSCL